VELGELRAMLASMQSDAHMHRAAVRKLVWLIAGLTCLLVLVLTKAFR
jgi:hypothetical protein